MLFGVLCIDREKVCRKEMARKIERERDKTKKKTGHDIVGRPDALPWFVTELCSRRSVSSMETSYDLGPKFGSPNCKDPMVSTQYLNDQPICESQSIQLQGQPRV